MWRFMWFFSLLPLCYLRMDCTSNKKKFILISLNQFFSYWRQKKTILWRCKIAVNASERLYFDSSIALLCVCAALCWQCMRVHLNTIHSSLNHLLLFESLGSLFLLSTYRHFVGSSSFRILFYLSFFFRFERLRLFFFFILLYCISQNKHEKYQIRVWCRFDVSFFCFSLFPFFRE